MKKPSTLTAVVPAANIEEAWQEVGAASSASVDCGAGDIIEHDERRCCRALRSRYGREDGKAGHRWGKTKGKLGFDGGKVELERPGYALATGKRCLPSWEEAVSMTCWARGR